MPFSFDQAALHYRDLDTGRLVPDGQVRRALDQVIDAQTTAMRALTQQLLDGTLALATWQLLMMQQIKQTHLVALAVAHGGWTQLDQSAFGWVGAAQIKPQYQYLAKFTIEIQTGKQALDGTVLARAALYAEAARATHRAAVQRQMDRIGMAEERNQLGQADHCRGCLRETRRGWVPIGSLVPCGRRDCMVRCHCSIEYRAGAAA